MIYEKFNNKSIEELKEYYIKNIYESEKLRREITLSEDYKEILEKSLLCIFLLTEDVAFYKTNLKKINVNASIFGSEMV